MMLNARRLIPLTLGASALACVPLAAPATAAAPRTATVVLKDISFKKATVRIAPGGTVTWVFKDKPSPHNVTFATRHSATKQTGTYTLRFAKAGTYRYHCTIHPGMDGKVIVR